MNRREFLGNFSFSALSYRKIIGANNRLRVGFIGTGIMGRGNLANCLRQKNTEVTFLCDVYEANLAKAVKKAAGAKTSRDFRDLLDNADLDAVCVSTPDHWHAHMTVEAFKSGKHVYCEKPIAHRACEIPVMIAAQRKYGKVFQSGQWQRSANQFIKAIEVLKSGKAGKIQSAFCFLAGYSPNIGYYPNTPPPKELGDWGWNMWLGPAPFRPFNWNRFTTNPVSDPGQNGFSWFRFFWDYANGMIGDWGPHLLDIAFWGSFVSETPWLWISGQGRRCQSDNKETPDESRVEVTEYPGNGSAVILFEHSGCGSKSALAEKQTEDHGIEFYCQDGNIFVNRKFFRLTDKNGRMIEKEKSANDAGRDHWENFVSAIRNGHTETRTGLDKVAVSNTACLLGAAAYRMGGGSIGWDFTNYKLVGPPSASKFLEFNYRQPWQLKA